jgi:hypothetical protein
MYKHALTAITFFIMGYPITTDTMARDLFKTVPAQISYRPIYSCQMRLTTDRGTTDIRCDRFGISEANDTYNFHFVDNRNLISFSFIMRNNSITDLDAGQILDVVGAFVSYPNESRNAVIGNGKCVITKKYASCLMTIDSTEYKGFATFRR